MKKIFYSFMMLFVAAITFTSCEDVPMPYDAPGTGGGNNTETTTIEPTGSGTADDPFNVAAAIEKCKETGTTVTTETYYVKGIVKSVDVSGVAQYGNINIDMIDEGGSNVFKAFQIYSFNSKKFTADVAESIKEGDEVVVKGNLVNYMNNTPETNGKGTACLVSLNGKTEQGGGNSDPTTPTGEAKGDGTLENPFNSVAANAYASTLESGAESDKDVYIKGKVVSVKEQFGTQYGNATFYISDDGTSKDQFYAFRILYLNNEKYTSGALLEVGDDVIICGKLTNYMGNTPETVQGKAFLYSLQSNGGGNQGGGNQGGEVSANSITIKCADLGLENGKDAGTLTLSDGTVLTFDGGGNNNIPKYYTTGSNIRMYPKNSVNVKASKAITSITIKCDNYNGTIYNASGDLSANPGSVKTDSEVITVSGINAKETTITNVSTTTGAPSQLRIVSMTISYAE